MCKLNASNDGKKTSGDLSDHPTISVIAAAYEDPQTVERFIDSTLKVMVETGESFELLLIDDGSESKTWKMIKQKAMETSYIRAWRLSRNFGKEAAIIAGLRLARGNAVIIMDADLQHPPALLPRFIALWNRGSIPIVEGIRLDRRTQGLIKRGFVNIYYALLRLLADADLKNSTDFVLLDRRIVNEFNRFSERQTYFRGLIHWSGFERAQVPFEISPRLTDKGKWTLLRQLKHAVYGLTSLSAKPVFFIMGVGVFGLIASFLLGIQTFLNWLLGHAFPGFSTVILLQLIFGSMELFCMGLIGIYIVTIFVEVKHRPRFIIDTMTQEKDYNPPQAD